MYSEVSLRSLASPKAQSEPPLFTTSRTLHADFYYNFLSQAQLLGVLQIFRQIELVTSEVLNAHLFHGKYWNFQFENWTVYFSSIWTVILIEIYKYPSCIREIDFSLNNQNR